MYLHTLPTNKKNVPELIRDPIALITDVRTLVGLHRHDDKDLAITGQPVLTGKIFSKQNCFKLKYPLKHFFQHLMIMMERITNGYL